MSLILATRRLCSNVLLNARAVFLVQKDCFHECQPFNTTHPTSSDSDSDSDKTSQNQSHQESTHQDTSNESSSEHNVKHKVLTAALEHVHVHGWTTQALSEGARDAGLPGVAHGIFPRGGGDLMHHFVRECNNQLVERLAAQSQELEEEEEEGKKRRRTSAFIRDALETRFRMIIPYVESWPQAMALTALPANVGEHFSNLSQLMDDIWYHAGDESTDFNWYTKRLSLAAVYKSTELHLVQDDSQDFQETWLFLDRRLADVATFGKFRADVDNALRETSNIASAAFTTGRNMIGLNDRRR